MVKFNMWTLSIKKYSKLQRLINIFFWILKINCLYNFNYTWLIVCEFFPWTSLFWCMCFMNRCCFLLKLLIVITIWAFSSSSFCFVTFLVRWIFVTMRFSYRFIMDSPTENVTGMGGGNNSRLVFICFLLYIFFCCCQTQS
jgi:hypothetical protein